MDDGGTQILVVDDDEGMREAIESLLDAAGFRATVYPSAEALLSADTVDAAACVITDLKLPAMPGLELLATLRARTHRPAVIVITAHDVPGLRDQAMQLGATAYFTKPFAGGALLSAIEKATGPHVRA